jgi:hypothetical protein
MQTRSKNHFLTKHATQLSRKQYANITNERQAANAMNKSTTPAQGQHNSKNNHVHQLIVA